MNPNPQFLEKLCETLGERVELAAQLVDVISTTSADSFAKLASLGFDIREGPNARKALEVLVRHGVLTGSSDEWRINPCACNVSLAAALQGAAVSRRLEQKRERAVVAATLPTGAGALASMLPELGRTHALVETTGAAFEEIARAAKEDFTVFAPFLNDKGAAWLRDLFVSTSATERSLVIRDWTRSRPVLNPVLDELASLGVQVFDYFLLQDHGYETFHAKMLIADNRWHMSAPRIFCSTEGAAWSWACW